MLKKLYNAMQQHILTATLVAFSMSIGAYCIDHHTISTWLASGGLILSSLLILNDTPFIKNYFQTPPANDTETPIHLVPTQNVLIFTVDPTVNITVDTQTVRSVVKKNCKLEKPSRPD